MTFRISVAARNAQASGMMAALNGGSMGFRTGTQPALITDTETGTLLGTLTLQATAEGSVANGVSTAALPVTTNSTIAGTIGWCRVYDSVGGAYIDGTVTATGGGGDIIVTTVVLSDSDMLELVSFTLTAPAI